jgi:hypothetical protein
MKTHKVLDLVYTEEEQGCFAGTEQECQDFITSQGGATFMYKVVPMTKEEYEIENETV